LNPKKALLAALVLGVVAVALVSLAGDLPKTLSAAATSSPLVIGAALGLALANYLLRSLKWLHLLRRLHPDLDLRAATTSFFAGLSMSMTPGKLGELLKAVMLKETRQVPMTVTAPAVLVDRLTDLLALLALVTGGVLALGYGLDVVLVGAAMCALVMLAVLWPPMTRLALRVLAWVPVLGRHVAGLEGTLRNCAALLRPGTLLWTTALSALAWFAECLAFQLILRDLGAPSTLFHAVFIYSLGTIAGAVSMLPGGLIATEGSMLFLVASYFQLLGEGAAAAAVLLVRFCTLWFAVLLGSAVLFGVRDLRRSVGVRGGR
jgi:uncharacterized membrane protein YbhN (UPF0104 family)